MSAPEPEGCWYQWGYNICLLDRGHDGPHECMGETCPRAEGETPR